MSRTAGHLPYIVSGGANYSYSETLASGVSPSSHRVPGGPALRAEPAVWNVADRGLSPLCRVSSRPWCTEGAPSCRHYVSWLEHLLDFQEVLMGVLPTYLELCPK